jgi:DNA ligase (NAD+)
VTGYQSRAGLIAKLLSNGIVVQSVSGPLLGKSFCLTGFRDAELQEALEKNGGTVKSGVSKGLDYLIAQDPTSTSGKAQKARQYGTTVIGVEDAWAMVGGKV